MANNKKIVLIMGKPNMGKSTSLMGLRNQEQYAYLNTDMKDLPFKDNFKVNAEISDSMKIMKYVHDIENEQSVSGAILDTITFLMSMYERQYVQTATNTQAAWGQYANFYKEFIHSIKAGSKSYAILAHEETIHNEQTMQMEAKVPIKGSVGKTGIEADFTTILSAKQIPIAKLEGFENDLLNITDEEKEDGFKYVLATRITKESVGDKTRSAMGLWQRNELYIDNNLQTVFDRLDSYYS